MKELKNKTAVITGAGSGIGLSIAKRCAECGVNLVLADIEAGTLSAALGIVKEKCEAVSVLADVSEEDDVKEIYDTAVDSGGFEPNGLESILDNITKSIDSMIKEGVENGKNPDEFADHVMESIKNDKFYIFSDDSWRYPFEKRVNEISSCINPLQYN